MTRLKICGLRDVDSTLVAAEAGADFLGFNFVPGVRRQLPVERARDIIIDYRRRRGGSGPRLVGIFADQPLDEVNSTVEHCGLDLAQLCGDETPEYWGGLSVPVIKQIRVREPDSLEDAISETLRRVDEVIVRGHMALLDRHEAGSLGGTGRTFDWGVAAHVAGRHELLLAGGLTPQNVGLAVETVAPWGVDVSSGVETGGVKDAGKIAAFARALRRADERGSGPPGTLTPP